MKEDYEGQNELQKLNEDWMKAMRDGNHELADNLQRQMDRLSEQAIKIADMKLKASLMRSGLYQ